MIFRDPLPLTRRRPPQITRQLSVLTLLHGGEATMTITTWRSVRAAPSGGITWHARIDIWLPDRYGSAYSSAGGCGYCKESSAVAYALRKLMREYPPDFPDPGSGMGTLERWLRSHGWNPPVIARDITP